MAAHGRNRTLSGLRKAGGDWPWAQSPSGPLTALSHPFLQDTQLQPGTAYLGGKVPRSLPRPPSFPAERLERQEERAGGHDGSCFGAGNLRGLCDPEERGRGPGPVVPTSCAPRSPPACLLPCSYAAHGWEPGLRPNLTPVSQS